MPNIHNAMRNAMLNGLDTSLPASSLLRVYSGSMPAAPEDAASGTLLAEVSLPATPWAAAASGAKAKQNLWLDTVANASGTAGWARLQNAGDTIRLDLSVGVGGSGADLEVSGLEVVANRFWRVEALTLDLLAASTANTSIALRNALLNTFDTIFPAGSSLRVRTGSPPASPDDAITGSGLVTITLPTSPWAAASAGSKAKQNLWEANGFAGGTAGFCRLQNAADTIRMDFTIGTSSADIIVNTLTVTNSRFWRIDTLTVSL